MRGGLWAVLPVKAWAEAKRRLSPILSGEERQELARSMLDDLLGAVGGSERIDGALAVTADPVAGEYLGRAGCELLPEPRRGLNRALAAAAEELGQRGASTMLVLPIDLPLATSADLNTLCARHGGSTETPAGPGSDPGVAHDSGPATEANARPDAPQAPPRAAVTVAPDRFRSGTNALACSPPGCIPFRFGDGSFRAHLHEAERAGAAATSLEVDGLSLDVDHPDDLAELLRRDSSSRTARFLNAIGTAERLMALRRPG